VTCKLTNQTLFNTLGIFIKSRQILETTVGKVNLIFAKKERESAMMSKAPTNLKVIHDRFFLIGFGLFFLGVIGGVFYLQQNQQRQIDHLISDKALAVIEIKLNKSNLDFVVNQLGSGEDTPIKVPGVNSPFTLSDFSPWLGQNLALGWLPNQQFLHAFDYRKKSDALAFAETFLLPAEVFTEIETVYGTVLTPSYSSKNAFMFYKGWLLWADNPLTLSQELSSPNKLKENAAYRAMEKDLPKLKFVKTYFNFAGDTSALTVTSENQSYAPLLRGLGTSTPQWGMTFNIKDNAVLGDIKVSTHKAVYDESEVVAKPANKTLPNLAYYAPKNALFFQNGEDLYAKYQHTKSYLNELDPQLSLVFEGLIRAQAENWFGVDFDFETDFLQLIRGSYAFILDFNQGLEIGFITTLGDTQNPDSINELIQKAQSRFTPITEEVELPDGSTRSELIASDPQNLPIKQNELNGQTYYSSSKDDGRINFSYTQIGDYLIMANRVNLIEKVISTQTNPENSLAANEDFRNSVLYEFGSAEVYGFVNAAKLNQLLFYWQETQTLDTPFTLNSLQNLRNLTFSRQVFPEVMYIKLRAFFN